MKEYEEDYRQTVTDLTLIKKDILAIESRLNEAMREVKRKFPVFFLFTVDSVETRSMTVRLISLKKKTVKNTSLSRNELLSAIHLIIQIDYWCHFSHYLKV